VLGYPSESGDWQRRYQSGYRHYHWLPIHFAGAVYCPKHHIRPNQHNDAAGTMKMYSKGRQGRRYWQQGAAAIEFALVCSVFFALLIGMMEMGRILFYWNSAAEATRLGARLAVVCDKDDTDIKVRMQERLSILPAAKITITYEPAGCTVDTCQSVTVDIAAGVSVSTFIPFVPLALSLPPFSTTLPRESMQSTTGGVASPMCS
jgi:Flp pilus assembly protein TadG